MLIPPKYTLTAKISQLLSSIEAAKEVINQTDIPVEIETNIRRNSTLKSSLFRLKLKVSPHFGRGCNHSLQKPKENGGL